MEHKIHIRKTVIADIPRLARLMGDLGYPVSHKQMETRLNNIGSHPDYWTLVACLKDKIIGMVGFHTGLLYNTDGIHIRVIALVTDKDYRGIGAGKKLMLAVEDYGEQLGAAGIVLNSGNRTEREDAHHFYLSLGYQAKSTGFVKTLN
ncbi:GNAT family N-acetyltransferase [Cytobacillus firmus]|uniref:Acetyltransferase, GNAT family n=1 Tax=Cytobacillus firmus TaxID=1399 RepID=A0A7Y5AW67_CYTFI|nr:GNAT family N-acetyltransferase [Cytobacillus firmus]KAF0822640.1 Acetyltransferase, GNAT family [Cytobacillus firmus]MBG9546743.1 GNAT family acetyltransferase [Cytobacillus firmus]MBG9601400.1 GNAT family acetyltransferase [Cytobacillus firmus]MBG9656960.1 GNAT family acetyltransferase [Cytobacillus firmus]MDD9311596.1 GNAT family N-acetyltransferase [Cytobacillus firmus]